MAACSDIGENGSIFAQISEGEKQLGQTSILDDHYEHREWHCLLPLPEGYKTVVSTSPAPFMASFTSRGRNVIDPTILKPNITPPGLNMLAAWSEEDAPTKLAADGRRVQWNIYSGTSMSCPHVYAAAALLKAVHPLPFNMHS